jgi:integrase
MLHTAKTVIRDTYNDPRTIANHAKLDSAWAHFSHFCSETGVEPLAADPDTAVTYLAYLSATSRSKSKTHTSTCLNFRSPTPPELQHPCDCKTSLRAASLKQHRYTAQANMRDRGRERPYDPQTGTGNPFRSAAVDRFIDAVESQQTDAAVSRQTPRFFTDEEIRRLLDTALHEYASNSAAGDKLLALRDLRNALIIALGHALMDRGADLVRLRMSQLIRHDTETPQRVDVLKSRSKTVRTVGEISPAVSIISSGDQYCVNRLLRAYVRAAGRLGIDVETGYLFRKIRLQAYKGTPPCMSTDMISTAEFRAQLMGLCLRAGVPPAGIHAIRRGKARALSLAGAPVAEIKVHGGWKTIAMTNHYSGAAKPFTTKRAKCYSP